MNFDGCLKIFSLYVCTIKMHRLSCKSSVPVIILTHWQIKWGMFNSLWTRLPSLIVLHEQADICQIYEVFIPWCHNGAINDDISIPRTWMRYHPVWITSQEICTRFGFCCILCFALPVHFTSRSHGCPSRSLVILINCGKWVKWIHWKHALTLITA